MGIIENREHAEWLKEKQLVIFDLDGTLRRCTKEGQPCPNRRGEQELLPGAQEGIQALIARGAKLAFATNQAGPAFGFSTRQDVNDAIRETMELAGISYTLITGLGFGSPTTKVFVAWTKDKKGFLRKPQPGMLLKAMVEWQVEPRDTLFIGDMDSDEDAARRANVSFIRADVWRSYYQEK